MKALGIIAIILVSLVLLIAGGFFYVAYEGYSYAYWGGYQQYAEDFKKLPEVQLFYEKHPTAKSRLSTSETLSYFATNDKYCGSHPGLHAGMSKIRPCFGTNDEDWGTYIEFEIFHDQHEVKRFNIRCDPVYRTGTGTYFITENILDYLQNYDCLEDKYP